MTADPSSNPPDSAAGRDGASPADDREALERIAGLFRAFSEPTRLALLRALMSGRRSVNDLVDELGATQANISKQLRILHDAELLSREKHGTKVFYEIADDIVFALCELACGKLNRDADKAGRTDFSI